MFEADATTETFDIPSPWYVPRYKEVVLPGEMS